MSLGLIPVEFPGQIAFNFCHQWETILGSTATSGQTIRVILRWNTDLPFSLNMGDLLTFKSAFTVFLNKLDSLIH